MKTESVLKFYFYHITIGNYVPDYFSTVDTGDIFRTTMIKKWRFMLQERQTIYRYNII